MKNQTTNIPNRLLEKAASSAKKIMIEKFSSDSSLRISSLTWLNSREAAAYLRISIPTLRNMVSRRQIPFYKLGIRRLRFSLEELDQLLLANKGD